MAATLLVIAGPTAVGKTSTAIQLAQHFETEILSFDSRQFYKEMNIGTAKPSEEELAAAPHHFINNRSIHNPYTAGHYEKEAIVKLKELFKKKEIVIAVGGSGLYLKALETGLDEFPDVPAEKRNQLMEEFRTYGIEFLQDKLKAIDPAYFEVVDKKNPNRLIRGIEVSEVAGRPYSSFLDQKKAARPFDIVKIGLEMDREVLYNRINKRVDLMMEAGLFEEAKTLFEHRGINALQTVGYKEIFTHLQGGCSLAEAITQLKTNTRRYAKRQFTWFRRDEQMKWFEPNQIEEMQQFIQSKH